MARVRSVMRSSTPPARYTRVATGMIAAIESPLDLLSQPRQKPGKSRKDQPPA